MKSFPTIPYYDSSSLGFDCLIFDKIDGSNIRSEFSSKRKEFYKFGTRNQLIGKDSQFYVAEKLIREKEEELREIFSKKYSKIPSIMCYFELHGPSSEFGFHDFDEPLQVTLIDVELFAKGFISPVEFVDNFESIGIPIVLYEGEFNQDIIDKIRNNDFLEEGGIVKSKEAIAKHGKFAYYKVKTLEWLRRLKERNFKMFEEESKQFSKLYSL